MPSQFIEAGSIIPKIPMPKTQKIVCNTYAETLIFCLNGLFCDKPNTKITKLEVSDNGTVKISYTASGNEDCVAWFNPKLVMANYSSGAEI